MLWCARLLCAQVTGTAWAIKVLKKADMVRMQQVEHVLNERRLLGTFNHPFIVKLAGTFQGAWSLRRAARFSVALHSSRTAWSDRHRFPFLVRLTHAAQIRGVCTW